MKVLRLNAIVLASFLLFIGMGAVKCSPVVPALPTKGAQVTSAPHYDEPELTRSIHVDQDSLGKQLQSDFIWAGAGMPPGNDGVAIGFRKTFSINAKPSGAALEVFADARYILWVNGEYVERGPARFQPNGPEYDTVDVTPYLQMGKNCIAILCVGNLSGGKVMRHQPGLSAVFQTQGGMLFSTDSSWKWSDSTRYRTVVATWPNLGETRVDATMEDGDWTQTGYDDTKWQWATRISGDAWGPLTARRIPRLRETAVPVHFAKEVTLPVTLRSGNTLEFTTGRIVQAYPDITFDADQGTEFRIEPYGVSYTARAGRQSYFTTDSRGIMSGSIHVNKGRITITGFKLIERIYPFDCAASFKCSDPYLVKLWALCVRSCQVLSEDSYVDCADRERVEWMDDSPPAYDVTRTAMAVKSSNGKLVYGDPRLLEELIRRTALTLQPGGWVKAHTCSDRFDIHAKMEDRACDWVEGIRLYEEATGDLATVREIWPAVTAQMNYFLSRLTERGLVRCRDWVVWGNPVGYLTGEGTTVNVFVYRALEDAATLGSLIHERADSDRFAHAAENLKQAINTVLWDESAGTYFAGYFTDADMKESGKSVPRLNNLIAPTLHASIFALDRGVVPPERQQRVLQAMVNQEAQEKARVMTYYYLARLLYKMDEPPYDQRVLSLLRDKWSVMVNSPTQCSWEDFDGGSHSHIYGMYPAYLLSTYVLGVRRDAPVSTGELRIEPHLADLANAEGIVVTEYGPVSVAWQKAGKKLDFALAIPAGAKTTLALPYQKGLEDIRIDGRKIKGIHRANRLEIPLSAGYHQGIY